jgi:hypothetical protein
MEPRICELREDFARRKIPTRDFAANALYLEVIRLAYNLVANTPGNGGTFDHPHSILIPVHCDGEFHAIKGNWIRRWFQAGVLRVRSTGMRIE